MHIMLYSFNQNSVCKNDFIFSFAFVFSVVGIEYEMNWVAIPLHTKPHTFIACTYLFSYTFIHTIFRLLVEWRLLRVVIIPLAAQASMSLCGLPQSKICSDDDAQREKNEK